MRPPKLGLTLLVLALPFSACDRIGGPSLDVQTFNLEHRSGYEAAELIGMEVDVEIPFSRAVPLSMNHGEPVVEAAPRSPAARCSFGAAQMFLPEAEQPTRRSFFSWR